MAGTTTTFVLSFQSRWRFFFITIYKTCPSWSLYRLDYVSSSNEVDVHFHTDFSDTQTGFEIVWRAVDVTSCLSGKTILTGSAGNGFPIHDATFYTPNFPHFNLPHLNCIYTIVAPGKYFFIFVKVTDIFEERKSFDISN